MESIYDTYTPSKTDEDPVRYSERRLSNLQPRDSTANSNLFEIIGNLVTSCFNCTRESLWVGDTSISNLYKRVMDNNSDESGDYTQLSASIPNARREVHETIDLTSIVLGGDFQKIAYLISTNDCRRLDFTKKDRDGNSPIMVALIAKKLDIFLLLMTYIAPKDVKKVLDLADENHCGEFVEESLLRLAIANGRSDLLAELIKYGTNDINCRDGSLQYKEELLKILYKFQKIPTLFNAKSAIVKQLAKMGVVFDLKEMKLEFELLELKAGSNKYKPRIANFKPLDTSINIAIQNKQLRLARILIKEGADIFVRDQSEVSIKEIAEKMGIEPEVKKLIDARIKTK